MGREKIDHYRSEYQRNRDNNYAVAVRAAIRNVMRVREEEAALAQLEADNERRRQENEEARAQGQNVPIDHRNWEAGLKYTVLDFTDIEYNLQKGRVEIKVLYDGIWEEGDNPKWEDLSNEHTSNPCFPQVVTKKWRENRGFNTDMMDILESMGVFVNANGTVYSDDMEDEEEEYEVESSRGRGGTPPPPRVDRPRRATARYRD